MAETRRGAEEREQRPWGYWRRWCVLYRKGWRSEGERMCAKADGMGYACCWLSRDDQGCMTGYSLNPYYPELDWHR